MAQAILNGSLWTKYYNIAYWLGLTDEDLPKYGPAMITVPITIGGVQTYNGSVVVPVFTSITQVQEAVAKYFHTTYTPITITPVTTTSTTTTTTTTTTTAVSTVTSTATVTSTVTSTSVSTTTAVTTVTVTKPIISTALVIGIVVIVVVIAAVAALIALRRR
jgi:peptide/nickel transport system substrate-binding protein